MKGDIFKLYIVVLYKETQKDTNLCQFLWNRKSELLLGSLFLLSIMFCINLCVQNIKEAPSRMNERQTKCSKHTTVNKWISRKSRRQRNKCKQFFFMSTFIFHFFHLNQPYSPNPLRPYQLYQFNTGIHWSKANLFVCVCLSHYLCLHTFLFTVSPCVS